MQRERQLLERSMTISSSHHLIDENIKALDEIEGISEVYTRAIDKFENEVSRVLFLKMPDIIMYLNVVNSNKVDVLLDDFDDELGESLFVDVLMRIGKNVKGIRQPFMLWPSPPHIEDVITM
ncbi:hypothetical protein PanWU01x14_217490 [Parasponia andersonii]|uniref:Uncharacterized protein n=1 Tax=Parasponia andersonii TaxID=3476 RepID=A0A2P5BR88_PARAD|nr:hypothetical protein PanWU01x14_217490 [Parasponia andersonii]